MSAGILTRSRLQRDQTLFLSFIQGSAGQRDSQIRWQKKVIKNIKSLKKISVWRLIFDIWHMINTENEAKTCISFSNTGFCCPKPSQVPRDIIRLDLEERPVYSLWKTLLMDSLSFSLPGTLHRVVDLHWIHKCDSCSHVPDLQQWISVQVWTAAKSAKIYKVNGVFHPLSQEKCCTGNQRMCYLYLQSGNTGCKDRLAQPLCITSCSFTLTVTC